MVGAAGGGGSFRNAESRCTLSRLNLDHVRHVFGVKQLGTKDGKPEGCGRLKHFLDPFRFVALPARADNTMLPASLPVARLPM